MKLDNILSESNREDITYSFWVDSQGNLLLDINDNEELADYIKRKSTELNKSYEKQLNGSDITKLSIPEIINRISWLYVRLYGYRQNYELYDLDNRQEGSKIEKKNMEGNLFDRMKIRTDFIINPNKNLKNKSLDRIIERIVSIYPSIKRVKVVGANDNSTEFYL